MFGYMLYKSQKKKIEAQEKKYDYKYHYCWIAFKLSGITDGITHYPKDYTGNYIRDNSGKRIKERTIKLVFGYFSFM